MQSTAAPERRWWTSRCARADPLRLAFASALVLVASLAGTAARAQSIAGALSDPKKCVVILDGMGDVGFRISDSGMIADGVITAIRKRVGYDGAQYAGVAESAAAMKKLLATPEGGGPQEEKLAWFKVCEANAPWRIKARFGTGKKGALPHWVTVSCRKKDAKESGGVVDEQRFEGKTFLEARDALVAGMAGFCGPIPSMGVIPVEPGATPPGLQGIKKKEIKPWTPPPRRD